jgi:hypothetical protein
MTVEVGWLLGLLVVAELWPPLFFSLPRGLPRAVKGKGSSWPNVA